jgi:putative nucleotidyltransferase with HDIG domain
MLDLQNFKSRVARRLLALFMISALAPTVALAVLSYLQVTRQLTTENERSLEVASEAAAEAILERLTVAREQVEVLSTVADLSRGNEGVRGGLTHGRGKGLAAAALVPEEGPPIILFGEPPRLDPGLREQLKRLAPSEQLLHSGDAGLDGVAPLSLAQALPNGSVIWAEIDPQPLWTTAETYASLRSRARLCVLDSVLRPVFCPGVSLADFRDELPVGASPGRGVPFQYSSDGEKYFGSFRPLFLRFVSRSSNWAVVVSESEDNVLAHAAGFRFTFPLVAFLSLGVVLLLSTTQIRRSMEPIVSLSQATKRIAARDFDSRVEVRTKDEFAELGDSFNAMAEQLKRQFETLSAVNAVDRAALSSMDERSVVETALAAVSALYPDGHPTASVLASSDEEEAWAMEWLPGLGPHVTRVTWSEADARALRDRPHAFFLPPLREDRPGYLPPYGPTDDPEPELVVPMAMDGYPLGVVTVRMGFASVDSTEISRIRQITDQVTLSLSHFRVVRQMEALTTGALTALARTVDAKSPWTSGHSERVASLSLEIGRQLGLPDDDLAILWRGGLLHDIGKIGVPASILDKRGRLTDEEYRLMKDHTVTGARILEPIGAYADLIPLVLYHHERLDGSGYPESLVGEATPWLARIVAVADTFDAMTSDRPYRAGMSATTAHELIAQMSGVQFDKRVVSAFQIVMGDRIHEDDADLLPARPLEEAG